MKFSATGINSNAFHSGSLSFLQRCLYPQVRPRSSRGFSRALHSHLNRHGGGTSYPSDLSRCIRNFYLSQQKVLTWQPSPPCTGVLCTYRNPLAPELHSNLTFSMPSYSHVPLWTFWRVFSSTSFSELYFLSQHGPTVQHWAKHFLSGFFRAVTLILRVIPELPEWRGLIDWKSLEGKNSSTTVFKPASFGQVKNIFVRLNLIPPDV